MRSMFDVLNVIKAGNSPIHGLVSRKEGSLYGYWVGRSSFKNMVINFYNPIFEIFRDWAPDRNAYLAFINKGQQKRKAYV